MLTAKHGRSPAFGTRIKVWRGGRTAPYPELEKGADPTIGCTGTGLRIAFQLRSKGGGITDVSVHIPPSEFDRLMQVMAQFKESQVERKTRASRLPRSEATGRLQRPRRHGRQDRDRRNRGNPGAGEERSGGTREPRREGAGGGTFQDQTEGHRQEGSGKPLVKIASA